MNRINRNLRDGCMALAGIVIALCMAANAEASSVKYDYDRDVDFSKWTTVAWKDDARPDGSMTARRIAKAVEAGFVERGYTFVEDAEKADFVLESRAVAWEDVRVQGVYHGPAFGRSVYIDREARGALLVDAFDPKTGRLVWHGVVSDALARNPEDADKKTAKAVHKLLQKFPAKGGKE